MRFVHDREPAVFPDFTGRIEFTGKRFSVKLKNLQLADSGVYTAEVGHYGGDRPLGDRTLAEYKVTVQAPVSPVKLSVVSVVSRSSASCDLTVNCSTQDSHISSTFTCVDGACSQEGGGGRSEVTTSGASLQVYLLNSSIVCHHSNQVHWTKDFKGTQHVCSQHADHNRVLVLRIAVGFTVLFLLILFGLFLYCRKRKNYEKKSIENTVYEIPLAATTPRLLVQSPTDEASGLSPTSTYSLVGAHTGSLEPSETRGPAAVESLYAQVEKPARSLNH